MKISFVILLTTLSCHSLISQVINNKYPYKVMEPQKIPKLDPGNYIFKDDIDYLIMLNSDPFHVTSSPPFFSQGEMGLILSRNFTSGSYSLVVDSVTETYTDVIVYTRIRAPNFRTDDMVNKNLFIKLKKTTKYITIMETNPNDY